MDSDVRSPHPNDPAEARVRMANEVRAMSGRERRQLLALIDAALTRIRRPRSTVGTQSQRL
jgi:hypothetical protein